MAKVYLQNADPVEATGPAEGAVNEPVTYDDESESQEAAQDTYESLSDPNSKNKIKRGVNDDCAPQPDGYGPKPTPDTVPAFLAYPPFAVCAALLPQLWNSAHEFVDHGAQCSNPSRVYSQLCRSERFVKCQHVPWSLYAG